MRTGCVLNSIGLTIVDPGAGPWEEDFSMDRQLAMNTSQRLSGAKRDTTTLETLH